MNKINRMAVVVLPREALIDWVNTVDPDHPVWFDSISDRGNVYLIPEFEAIEDAEDWVEDHYEDIFRNELMDWVADEDRWPPELTFEMFLEWFDLLFDVVAFDMVNEPIRKE